MGKRTICLVQAVVATCLAVAPLSARADSMRLQVDWAKTVVQAQEWLGANAAASHAVPEARPVSVTVDPDRSSAFVGTKPHVSFVGRDWNQSFLLSGRLSALDMFHLSRDRRMVFSRISLGDGTIVPFVQVGVGQWRVDTSWLPKWVCDTEVATQMGAGMELRVGGAYSVAVETDYTVLYREQRLPTNVPFPRMWGAVAAARVRF